MKASPKILSQKECKAIHLDTLAWKSSLEFVESEIQFIQQLLNSYVFEPKTPNLFERLQEFKVQLSKVTEEVEGLKNGIRKHESELGGILECDTISESHSYYQEHELMNMTFEKFYRNFRKLKSEVFSYAGTILKSNKN
ncbi:hypothetical protein [Aquimarina spongiae]|uniref:Uncharacterized protein n=1 Tax=Aquimarina spongiae TaxID=570521 RepID=A0A1M6I946_9FLAO|nr:hypothetical protein [Aquimarina spongiae]SHJ30942.1 hypothetical protein SAMN04488508_107192 [Aquimarina spongiae]